MSLDNLPSYIDIRIRASHLEFVNKNFLLYTENAANRALSSWLYPYNKPQLVGHDEKSDPVGRIIDAQIITIDKSKKEPPLYVELTARITEKLAIEKILDGRYYTVSIGAKTAKVICSECQTVLNEEGLCEHQKGTLNDKGDTIYWIVDHLDYVEDSFVNVPADEYAKIDSIYVNKEWVSYMAFVDNLRTASSEFKMEDHSMAKIASGKLSAEQRKKLSDSSFCGPGRSFPAHDKAHVQSGLKLLETLKVSDDAKSKIQSSLYRKGKRYGITPTKDELEENSDLLTFRMDDEWTKEEITEVEDFFKENPDADLPETEQIDEKESTDESSIKDEDVDKMKNKELKEYISVLKKQIEDSEAAHKEAVAARDKKIASLGDSVESAETLSIQREDEINKYMDQFAVLEKKFRDSVISNIIDIKMTDNINEDINDLKEKLSKRQTESLCDSLVDLRNTLVGNENTNESEEKVEDSTLKTDQKENSEEIPQNTEGSKTVDKFSLFDRDRSSTED